LLMLEEFSGDLNEIAALHRIAGLEVGMIAPDAKSHAIAPVCEGEFAIRFLLSSQFGCDRLELDMNARLHRTVGDGLANLPQS